MKVIKDYLSGKEIDVTHKPEEIVRQEILRDLHIVYGYPKENMATEVCITSGTSEVTDVMTGKAKRADIVIYKDSRQNYDEIYITILDKGIIIKQLKTQGQPTQERRHWRQRAAFLRGG